MKNSSACVVFVLTCCLLSVCRAAVEQFDFNGNLNSSVTANYLTMGVAAPALTPGVSFTTANINGVTAQVAFFTRGTWFSLLHGFSPNGGGSFINQYTLIMDVMFPSRPS